LVKKCLIYTRIQNWIRIRTRSRNILKTRVRIQIRKTNSDPTHCLQVADLLQLLPRVHALRHLGQLISTIYQITIFYNIRNIFWTKNIEDKKNYSIYNEVKFFPVLNIKTYEWVKIELKSFEGF